ncbi:hypothetical protein TWF481_011048 [Arthrobotrys musiformis]|uniref:J domain-containing protein n=1 Tax=Arthrobotrys musiformis TaxID=47236 RepID=A0AAV9W044_9PEZI
MPRSNLNPQGPPDYEFLPDWYGVLELAKEASASAIRTAYKRLAFQYHPDKTLDEKLKPEMTKRFTQIQEAYEVLSDSRRRREYDEDLTLEVKILEDWRRTQDVRERAARSRKAQTRHQEEERMRRAEDRQAEKDYLAAKEREEDLLRAAILAQSARKQHAADQERKKDTDRQRRKEETERRQRRAKEEEALRQEAEKLQRDGEQKQYARNHERRTRDRRHDRGHKVDMQFPIDDILDAEPLPFDAKDRGRTSKERLRDPTLHVPGEKHRDRSRQRDGSRHRERDRESEFTTRDFEHSRKHRFYAEAGARRMSTEPIHEDYMRTAASSLYGSPPHSSYSIPRSAASYSPPPSPRMRHSNPTMNSSAHGFQGPNKGRDRTRDRPGERQRKHSEAGLYSRDSFPSSIPEDINGSIPGNRDSGYSTSSAGTTVHPSAGPRLSAEKLDSSIYEMDGKKYKARVVYVTDSDEEGTGSTIGKTRSSKRASKKSSRDDPISAYAPRHQPTVELDDDPFLYMQTGSKTFPFTHKDVNYGAKISQVHTRSNSDQSAPGIQIDLLNESMAGMGMGSSGHRSRHAPTVGGSGGLPTFSRHQTWAA